MCTLEGNTVGRVTEAVVMAICQQRQMQNLPCARTGTHSSGVVRWRAHLHGVLGVLHRLADAVAPAVELGLCLVPQPVGVVLGAVPEAAPETPPGVMH